MAAKIIVPEAARVRQSQSILEALSDTQRELILALLLEAGRKGLRPAELAGQLGKKQPEFHHHLKKLTQTLLVTNEVGRTEEGIYSRYFATDLGKEWFTKVLGEPAKLVPVLVAMAA